MTVAIVRHVAVVGFRPSETAAIIETLRASGCACSDGLDNSEQPQEIVFDIRSHHPIMGGATGWEVVRHLLHSGHRLVAVMDPSGQHPSDLQGPRFEAVLDCEPRQIADALQKLCVSASVAA
jgi:hypothetical protein